MIVLWILLGIVLLLGIGAAWQIDDWSRDLTTNTATTDEDSPDEDLRPWATPAAVELVAEQIQAVAGQLPGWQFVQLDARAGAITVQLVRRSALFQFADDIALRIEPRETGSLVTAQSRSRIGKGDLGQNPRNIKQILRALKLEFKDWEPRIKHG
jgi:uncharacterized protein (DUF1499 family)